MNAEDVRRLVAGLRLPVAVRRLMVSSGAVLSVTEAADLLGSRRWVRWLRVEGLVRVQELGDGGDPLERVVWADVLARLGDRGRTLDDEPPTPQRSAQRTPRRRLPMDETW